jgi:hypothetical protein
VAYAVAVVGGMLTGSALSSCEDDVQVCEGPACGAGGEGGATIQGACPDSGVLHGPWALHFDETSVLVRWDACAPSSTDIVVEPEAGGAPLMFSGEQTASDVRTSYSLINGVPPDLPGVYYRTEVEVSGLAPSQCYRYTLDADSGRSGRFCTARAAGDPFRFFAVGDTNPSVGDTSGVLEHSLAEPVDFTIHLGDIQYYASVFESWHTWFPAMAPMLRAGAFQPSVGNHEYEIDFEFQDYYARLFGGAGYDSPAVEYYRFQSGGVWFFSLSTEEDLDVGSPQALWLENQIIDAAAKPGYRFGVVYFHKPMITLSEYSQDVGAREHFKPIFEQYGVKLVMQGHVHGYERFVDGAITYVVSGGGGAALHDLFASVADRPAEAAMRQAVAETYHGTLIEVDDSEIRGRAVGADGSELDSFVIPLP